jgi:hypothetical protein
MLFRNKDGMIVRISKNDYKNDILYYKKIMNTVTTVTNTNTPSTQMNNMVTTISKLLQRQ